MSELSLLFSSSTRFPSFSNTSDRNGTLMSRPGFSSIFHVTNCIICTRIFHTITPLARLHHCSLSVITWFNNPKTFFLCRFQLRNLQDIEVFLNQCVTLELPCKLNHVSVTQSMWSLLQITKALQLSSSNSTGFSQVSHWSHQWP